MELPLGEECQKLVKGCWLLGVTKAEITKQGCKIRQLRPTGIKEKWVGWLSGERGRGEGRHEENPIMWSGQLESIC